MSQKKVSIKKVATVNVIPMSKLIYEVDNLLSQFVDAVLHDDDGIAELCDWIGSNLGSNLYSDYADKMIVDVIESFANKEQPEKFEKLLELLNSDTDWPDEDTKQEQATRLARLLLKQYKRLGDGKKEKKLRQQICVTLSRVNKAVSRELLATLPDSDRLLAIEIFDGMFEATDLFD